MQITKNALGELISHSSTYTEDYKERLTKRMEKGIHQGLQDIKAGNYMSHSEFEERLNNVL